MGAGRFVYVYNPEIYYKLDGGETTENVIRAWWYVWMTMLRTNTELQKRGLVIIVNAMGMSDNFVPIAKELRRARDAMPMPKKAVHYCYDDESFRPWMAAMIVYMPKEGTRYRTRAHYAADHTEVLFKLQTYGIPVTEENFPANGSACVEWHSHWLTSRRRQEEQKQPTSDCVENDNEDTIIPGRHDVLFGKGRKMKEHPGNIACNLLVEMNQEAYERAGKFEKTDIAENIITSIHGRGGRFLKSTTDNEGWQEVERVVAREKISHLFRRLRKKVSTTTSSSKRVFQESGGRFIKQSRREVGVC